MKSITRVIAVTGIRSEYDILFPIINKINNDNQFCLKVVISGAHLSDWHGNTYERVKEDGFIIADRVDSLLATNRNTQRSKAVANLISGLTQTVERESPDLLLVVGDREESIATAIVGNYMGVLVAHVGGGDPVWGNSDDPIRMATSKLANLHLTTALPYSENLISLGEDSWRIKFTGTPGLDNIKNEPPLSKEELAAALRLDLKDYIVVLKHPLSSESESSYDQMCNALIGIKAFCEKNDMMAICIMPNSDPGSFDIIKAYKEFESDRIILRQTLPRNIFVNLLRSAKALAGNSSMGLLEAPLYKLPVVNIGNRQRGRLNAGNVRYVGYCKSEVIEALDHAVFDSDYRDFISNLNNPYGSGDAADIAIKFLKSIDLNDRKWAVKQKLI